jgi:predicted lipopolysaccharide heptosyltransferase III
VLVKGNNILPREIRSILLIQLGDIGDVVLTMPTIRALWDNLPHSRLVVAVREKARNLLDDCPWISEVVYINKQKRALGQELVYQKAFFSRLRRNKFDLAIDLRTGTRGAILAYLCGAPYRIGRYAVDAKLWRNKLFTHLVRPEDELSQHCAEHGLNILAPFDIETQNKSVELFVSSEKKKSVSTILQQENVPLGKSMVAVQPFSLWHYKEWGASNYVKLIDWIIAEFSRSVLIIGSADERARADDLVRRCGPGVYNLAGRTSLDELAALLTACDLLIGGDSAGTHIAAAVGTPTVCLFGPSSPNNWAPKGKQHRVIQKDWVCVPCRQKGCDASEVSRCLEELTVEEVRVVVNDQLSKIQVSRKPEQF